jgi:hypothetical protein
MLGIYVQYADNIYFTSRKLGTSGHLRQVLTVDRQIVITLDFVMALPCQCSYISSDALLTYTVIPWLMSNPANEFFG